MPFDDETMALMLLSRESKNRLAASWLSWGGRSISRTTPLTKLSQLERNKAAEKRSRNILMA